MEFSEIVGSSRARNIIVDGDYAYALLHIDHLVIYDVSNIINPNCENLAKENIVGFLPYSSSSPNALVKKGNFVITGDNTGRIRVVDVSDVANPVSVYYGRPQGGGSSQVFELAISDDKNIIGVAFASGVNQTVFIDVSNPLSPTLLKSFNGSSGGVAFEGSFAYSTFYGSNIANIFDISDKDDITLVNSFPTGIGGLSVPVQVKNNIVYVSDYSGPETRIFDVTDKQNPQFLSSITASGKSAFNNGVQIDCDGNFTYFVTSGGIELYNMIDKINPVKVWEVLGILDVGGSVQSAHLSQNRLWVARRNPDNFEAFALPKARA